MSLLPQACSFVVLVVCLCGFARISYSLGYHGTVVSCCVFLFVFIIGSQVWVMLACWAHVCWHVGLAWWTHQVVSILLFSSTAVCANALLFASVAPFLRWIFSCHFCFMHSLWVPIKSKSSPWSPFPVWASRDCHFASQLIQWVDWCAGWSSLLSVGRHPKQNKS